MRDSFDLLAFDLDGTLIDSAPDLSYALGEALESVGFPAPSVAQTRSWIGGGIDRLLKRALNDAGSADPDQFAAALAQFHQTYANNLCRRGKLYPGVINTLDTLGRENIPLCCITNKRLDYAQELLRFTKLEAYFDFTYGGDSFPEKKPHPQQLQEASQRVQAAVSRCVMIGDSEPDRRAAAAAGYQFIWVSFGYGQLAADPNYPKYATANAFQEIHSLLRDLGQ